MKRLLTMVVVCGVATTGFARPPMQAPEVINYQAQYSPTPIPVPNSAVPPSPGVVQAPTPTPTGAIVMQPQPVPMVSTPGCVVCDSAMGSYIPLYPRVKVIQSRNIAPCAVSKIVSVPDPCNPCGCVFISICVPPCACESVECSTHHNRTVFNYGKYAVKVTERHGVLVVNYDD